MQSFLSPPNTIRDVWLVRVIRLNLRVLLLRAGKHFLEVLDGVLVGLLPELLLLAVLAQEAEIVPA